ncbi:MAG: pseudouridine synthase [Anaerolineae bacterium]
MAQERLNKVMANTGIASRRACDEMIQASRVTVNGHVITELGVKVDPALDQVRVDGELIKASHSTRRSYLMLYKPAGVLSVFDDPRGRPGLEALLKGPVRLYPVGRLDLDSEGLLLLTDDGDLTLKLSHPRYEHAKTYLVLVDRPPGTDTLARFRRGIQLDDGVTAPSQWRVLEHPVVLPPSNDPAAAEGIWLHVTLYEGRKRQVRRMAAAEQMQVRRLVRIGVGSLKLDRKLQPGQNRALTRRELDSLLEEIDASAAEFGFTPPRPGRGRGRGTASQTGHQRRGAWRGRDVRPASIRPAPG